jgi:EAL domain-containing protein (putative c-di-GMP-specific phosphodiesterase class I)
VEEKNSPFEHGLRQIVELADQLDVRVYADGVDTQAIADRLFNIGVQYAAGAAIGDPMTEDEVERLIGGGR